MLSAACRQANYLAASCSPVLTRNASTIIIPQQSLGLIYGKMRESWYFPHIRISNVSTVSVKFNDPSGIFYDI